MTRSTRTQLQRRYRSLLRSYFQYAADNCADEFVECAEVFAIFPYQFYCKMEFFVRLLLIIIKLVTLWAKLLSLLWARIWSQPAPSRLPPIENRLLTHSVQELRARLRARQVRPIHSELDAT